MGKFDGILMVSDLDGTLLCTDKSISQKNLDAIAAFEDAGGLFTFITGRAPIAMSGVLAQYRPKIPMGVLNGGGIYDENTDTWIKRTPLSRESLALVEYVEKEFPTAGIEIVTFETCYFLRMNEPTEELRRFEGLPNNRARACEVFGDFCKILFIDEADRLAPLMEALETHPDRSKFELVRTGEHYYELIPKGCTKGGMLQALAKHLGVDLARTIAVGDNDNDVSMILAAGVGVAVANASPAAKQAADLTLGVTNDEDAIADIVARLERGSLFV